MHFTCPHVPPVPIPVRKKTAPVRENMGRERLSQMTRSSSQAAGSLLPLISINGLINPRLCRIPMWVSTPFKYL